MRPRGWRVGLLHSYCACYTQPSQALEFMKEGRLLLPENVWGKRPAQCSSGDRVWTLTLNCALCFACALICGCCRIFCNHLVKGTIFRKNVLDMKCQILTYNATPTGSLPTSLGSVPRLYALFNSKPSMMRSQHRYAAAYFIQTLSQHINLSEEKPDDGQRWTKHWTDCFFSLNLKNSDYNTQYNFREKFGIGRKKWVL